MRSVEKRGDLEAAATAAGVLKNLVVTQMDVNSDESVSKAFASLLSAEKRLDVLVNNAGYTVFGTVELVPMDACKAQVISHAVCFCLRFLFRKKRTPGRERDRQSLQKHKTQPNLLFLTHAVRDQLLWRGSVPEGGAAPNAQAEEW